MLAKIDRVRLLIQLKGPQTSTQIADHLGELVQPTAGYLSAAFLKGMLHRELVNGRFVYDIKRPVQY